jgi:hypothetical protein
MNSKIKGTGIIASIYVVLNIFFFEKCISNITHLRPLLVDVLAKKTRMMVSDDP